MQINRRDFLKTCAAAAGGYALLSDAITFGGESPSGELAKTQKNAKHPNFIIILADDLGYRDLGCFQSPYVKTPNIDRFAAESMIFRDCYAASPVCSPSRTALLTGRNPNRAGVYNYIDPNNAMHLPRKEITLAKLLKKAGYETCHTGKWHLNGSIDPSSGFPQPSDHGFDYSFGTTGNLPHYNPVGFYRNGVAVDAAQTKGYSCDSIVNDTINWLEKKRDKNKPFFTYVCFHEPHNPISPVAELPQELMSLYPAPIDEEEARYFATISNMDRAIGVFLKKIDELQLRENTIVVFLSDNGPVHEISRGSLRGKKSTIYEGGIRTPGIIRWPGQIKAGSVCDEPITFADIAPTFCDIAGVSMPKDRIIDGCDILPLFENKPIERKTPLFWFFYRSNPQAALRIGDWMLLGYLNKTIDISDRRNLQLRQSHIAFIKNTKLVKFELYNIENDSSQSHDLAKAEPERFAAMKKKMIQMHQSVIAEGPVWKGLPAP
jgi:arylsulfatase A